MMALFMPRTIVVNAANATNFNLRNAAGLPSEQVTVFCVASGTVTATATTTPAFSTGIGWAPGSNLFLINNGAIQGKAGANGTPGTAVDGAPGLGGVGGTGGSGTADDATAGSSGGQGSSGSATRGGNGGDGGVAVEALYPLIVANNGTIKGGDAGLGGKGGVSVGGKGGGGGGGGGGGARYSMPDGSGVQYYQGGNGGRGFDGNGLNGTKGTTSAVSAGGDGGAAQTPGLNGNMPSSYSPGLLVVAYPGRAGGPAGKAGNTIIASDGYNGAAGYSVSGYNRIQFISTGTLLGPTK